MYMKCIECESDDGFKANYFKEAAMVMKQHDTHKYLELIKQAIKLYQLAGRMSQACNMCKDCAEKPPNTTEWVAPMRAHACMAATPSMDMEM